MQHCLQMDTALTAAEMRASDLDRRLRAGGGRGSDVETKESPSSQSTEGDAAQPNTPGDPRDPLAAGTRAGTGSPEQTWAPAPMSQEVHKALVEQSLLPAGRTQFSRQGSAGGPGTSNVSAAGPGMIKLLLVEDDPFQADAIRALCEQCGYRAQVASSASEALELVRTQPDINLVLSDVMMEELPVMICYAGSAPFARMSLLLCSRRMSRLISCSSVSSLARTRIYSSRCASTSSRISGSMYGGDVMSCS